MKNFAILALLLHFAQGQTFKTRKIRACIDLVGYKLDDEEMNIESIMDTTLIDPQATITKIMCDLLLHCFHSLSQEEVDDVLNNPQALRQDLVDRLAYDKSQFSTGSLTEISPSEYELLDEIFIEIDNRKSDRKALKPESYSNYLILTILFILSCGMIFYVFHRSMNSYPFKKPRVLRVNRV